MVAASALTVVASASAATYNGDLIVGFTTASGNDLVYDLGSEPSLVNGETWNLNSLLGSSLNTSSVNWGVIGSNPVGGVNTTFSTTASMDLVPNTVPRTGYTGIRNAVASVYSLMPAAGQGNSEMIAATGTTSWNTETLNPQIPGDYKNAYGDPNSVGYTTEVLWGADNASDAPVQIGTFSFDNTGTLTFDSVSVPEPSTYGLFAGVGLLAISLRRQFAKA